MEYTDSLQCKGENKLTLVNIPQVTEKQLPKLEGPQI